jgi:hypothetical protein
VECFDEYVSLGYNCEVGFQIRRILGHDEASYFSWGIFPIDSIIALIEAKFCGVFNRDSLAWDKSHQLPRETTFDFAFHGPWHTDNPTNDPDFERALSEYRHKAAHLARKFLRPGGNRLYIYKPICTQPKEKVDRLAQLLASISPQSTMVLLRLSYETSSNATHPMIVERVLEHAAPADAVDRAHEPSWDRLFAEFPHKAIRPPYRTDCVPSHRLHDSAPRHLSV